MDNVNANRADRGTDGAGDALTAALLEALDRVTDRISLKGETLAEAVEAVYPDYGGLDFAARLTRFAQGGK